VADDLLTVGKADEEAVSDLLLGNELDLIVAGEEFLSTPVFV